MEKEKLYDKWTATGLETIKACVEDKIANYCELNKKQCQEVLNLIEKQQKEIESIKEYINSPEFLDWNLGFKLIDELEYRKDRINELLGE